MDGDRLRQVYWAAAKAYDDSNHPDGAAEYVDEPWFRLVIDAALKAYRAQRKAARNGRKETDGPRGQVALQRELQQLRDQVVRLEAERDKWRDATKAMASESRAEEWLAMVDIARAADAAMNVLDGVSMVFSRQSGKTSVGNALVPLIKALARYHQGPNAGILTAGKNHGCDAAP
jgi:hypothetical protein